MSLFNNRYYQNLNKKVMKLIDKFLLATFGIKPLNTNPIKPCGINRTIVPKSFLKIYPIWDSHKFNNQIYID